MSYCSIFNSLSPLCIESRQISHKAKSWQIVYIINSANLACVKTRNLFVQTQNCVINSMPNPPQKTGNWAEYCAGLLSLYYEP